MAKDLKTTKKRPAKPFVGNEGVTFTKDNQPTPEAKKKGWEELRKERHLTRSIIKEMLGEDGIPNEKFGSYIEALIKNAKAGNPKAIDAVNKCIEDDIIKVAATDTEGNSVPIFNFTPAKNCEQIKDAD
jgi:hypothetical protein